MKLYGFSRSSAAFRVRIALNLKGLAHKDGPSICLVANSGKPSISRSTRKGWYRPSKRMGRR